MGFKPGAAEFANDECVIMPYSRQKKFNLTNLASEKMPPKQ